MSDDCLDQVYFIPCASNAASYGIEPIWEGYAAHFTQGGFKGVVEKLIEDDYTLPDGITPLKPGPYIIVRLDQSVDKDADPILAWVGTVDDNLVVSDGYQPAKAQRVTRWPPK